ncbi:MAG: macro domain-containing protein [Gemmatimonadales bacterium]
MVVDDLATLPVDAVLRPAGESLEPLAEAAARLDRIAGQRFADQHRVSSPLEAGAAVVTGGGDLPAPFVIHVVIRDSDRPVARTTVRRALVSAWQQAGEWGLGRIAAPLVGVDGGLSLEESANLLVETFPRPGAADHPAELCIVVERQADRDAVEAIVRRTA